MLFPQVESVQLKVADHQQELDDNKEESFELVSMVSMLVSHSCRMVAMCGRCMNSSKRYARGLMLQNHKKHALCAAGCVKCSRTISTAWSSAVAVMTKPNLTALPKLSTANSNLKQSPQVQPLLPLDFVMCVVAVESIVKHMIAHVDLFLRITPNHLSSHTAIPPELVNQVCVCVCLCACMLFCLYLPLCVLSVV